MGGRRCEAVTAGVRCQRLAVYQLSSPVKAGNRTWGCCGTHLRKVVDGALTYRGALTIIRTNLTPG